MDDGHVLPYLDLLKAQIKNNNYTLSDHHILIQYGRVRAGYACGELLFGKNPSAVTSHGIIHIIGERPGSGHHNFSAYLTVAESSTWLTKGEVDHNISKVISGISDTALTPDIAVSDTMKIINQLFTSYG